MQESGTIKFFNVSVEECNVTQTTIPGGFSLSLTLVPAAGTLVFAANPPPVFVCGCEYDTFATVGTVATVEIPEVVRDVTGESASFNASLRLYPDDSFSEPLLSGDAYPIASDRFYFEITTDSGEDVIGTPNCSVSPTGAESEYRRDLLAAYCYDPVFEATPLSSPGVDDENSNMVRFSIIKFKFAGFARVHVACTVVRCGVAPCGTCGGRRLGGRRELQESSAEQGIPALATADFVLPEGDYLELPGRALPGAVPEAASGTPAAIIAVVAAAAVLVAALVTIGVFLLRRSKMQGKGATEDADAEGANDAEGAKDADEAMEANEAEGDEENVGEDSPTDGTPSTADPYPVEGMQEAVGDERPKPAPEVLVSF